MGRQLPRSLGDRVASSVPSPHPGSRLPGPSCLPTGSALEALLGQLRDEWPSLQHSPPPVLVVTPAHWATLGALRVCFVDALWHQQRFLGGRETGSPQAPRNPSVGKRERAQMAVWGPSALQLGGLCHWTPLPPWWPSSPPFPANTCSEPLPPTQACRRGQRALPGRRLRPLAGRACSSVSSPEGSGWPRRLLQGHGAVGGWGFRGPGLSSAQLLLRARCLPVVTGTPSSRGGLLPSQGQHWARLAPRHRPRGRGSDGMAPGAGSVAQQ